MSSVIRPIVYGFLCLAAGAPAAEAQIYSWHDANGMLVLSHRPASARIATTYAVERADTIRVSKPAMVLRTSLFDSLIEEHATAHQVRPELVRAVIQVESAFNPKARSPKGAMGLMQLMPQTAAELGVKDPFDPGENIKGGVAYLKQLLTRYQQDETLALAAYNAGPGAVERYGQKVPPYRETRDYVDRIQAATPAQPDVPPAPAAPVATQIYRTEETVGDTVVRRYTNIKPKAGSAALVNGR
jgi:soluble lytic murein transglycosylase-like protein